MLPLANGVAAVVDEQDYWRAIGRTWITKTTKDGCNRPFTNMRCPDGRWRPIQLSRFILGGSDKTEVDHIDGDGLNNRRRNLRHCTRSQNAQNRRKSHGTLRFKGVKLERNRYRAVITHNRRPIHLGCFGTDEDAARAYDDAARKLFGEFAAVNFPMHAGERCCLSISTITARGGK